MKASPLQAEQRLAPHDWLIEDASPDGLVGVACSPSAQEKRQMAWPVTASHNITDTVQCAATSANARTRMAPRRAVAPDFRSIAAFMAWIDDGAIPEAGRIGRFGATDTALCSSECFARLEWSFQRQL